MEPKLTKTEQDLLMHITCSNYVSFCKSVPRKTLFEWKGELLTPKIVDKIMLSFGKIEKNEDPRMKIYYAFIKKFSKYAMDDKEFVDSLDE